MPTRIEKTADGQYYFEVEYNSYTGLNVQSPENIIPDTATPASTNFMFRNQELRSRPTLRKEFVGPDRNNPLLGSFSFQDQNSVYHTVCWNSRGMFQLNGNAQTSQANPWSYIGGPQILNQNPISYRSFAETLYWCNGGPFLASWNGLSQFPINSVAIIPAMDAPAVGGSLPGAPAMTGPLNIGAYYLGELNNQLILANVVVQDIGAGNTLYYFPNMIWYSANGIPNQWDPEVNTSAGFNPFLDVPDNITGILTIGIAGFLFRTNGITQMTPTGSGQIPFQFDHLWASAHGIGNVYPWSIAQYGNYGYFISFEQVYQMSVNSFQPIGGTARDAIYADLNNASGNPTTSFSPALALGYIYQRYTISIPLRTFTRHYQYDMEQQNWAQWDTPGLIVTGKEEQCFTGQLPSNPISGLFPPAVSTGGGSTVAGSSSSTPSGTPGGYAPPKQPPNQL